MDEIEFESELSFGNVSSSSHLNSQHRSSTSSLYRSTKCLSSTPLSEWSSTAKVKWKVCYGVGTSSKSTSKKSRIRQETTKNFKSSPKCWWLPCAGSSLTRSTLTCSQRKIWWTSRLASKAQQPPLIIPRSIRNRRDTSYLLSAANTRRSIIRCHWSFSRSQT